MIFLYLALLLSIVNASGVKLGFIYQDIPPSHINTQLLEDFKKIINETGVGELPDFVSIGTSSDGSRINDALNFLKDEDITHVFSAVIFEDRKLINDAFKRYSMTLWSTTPYAYLSCLSNVVHYGSINKAIEKCIYY